jgi:hypothetical protein
MPPVRNQVSSDVGYPLGEKVGVDCRGESVVRSVQDESGRGNIRDLVPGIMPIAGSKMSHARVDRHMPVTEDAVRAVVGLKPFGAVHQAQQCGSNGGGIRVGESKPDLAISLDGMRAAGRCASQDEASYPSRMVDGDPLRHPASHRGPIHVDLTQTQLVQHGDGIVGESFGAVPVNGPIAQTGAAIVHRDCSIPWPQVRQNWVPPVMVVCLPSQEKQRAPHSPIIDIPYSRAIRRGSRRRLTHDEPGESTSNPPYKLVSISTVPNSIRR